MNSIHKTAFFGINVLILYRDEGDDAYKICFFNDAADREKIVAPFFNRISESLLNCSRNVEFLHKLNKMQCVSSEILMDGEYQ